MKKRICVWLALAMLILLASCGKQESYERVLPSDLSVLMSVNINSLVQKANLQEKENQKVWEKLQELCKDDSYALLEHFLKNPSSAGISCENDVYLFITSKQRSGLVAKVQDEKALEQTIRQIVKNIELVDKGDYKEISDNDRIVAFNKEVVVILLDEKNHDNVKKLILQKKEDSFAATELFEKVKTTGGDIKMGTFPFSNPMYITSTQMFTSIPNSVKATDFGTIFSLTFNKGRIDMNTELYYANEELKKAMEIYKEIGFGAVNGTLLKTFSKTTIGSLSINIDGEKILDFVTKNKMLAMYNNMIEDEIKEAISSLNGDIILSISTVKANGADFVAKAEVKNRKLFDVLLAYAKVFSGEKLQSIGNDVYSYELQGELVKFGMENNVVYIMSSVEENTDGETLASAPWISNIGKAIFFLEVDFKEILKSSYAKEALTSNEKYPFVKILDYMDISNDKGEIVMIDKEKNSLESIVSVLAE